DLRPYVLRGQARRGYGLRLAATARHRILALRLPSGENHLPHERCAEGLPESQRRKGSYGRRCGVRVHGQIQGKEEGEQAPLPSDQELPGAWVAARGHCRSCALTG
ncbi:unnamed protein product, partial [Effrenium voratum]